MHIYRTHDCGALRLANQGQTARLSGWVDRKRDHGNLLFIDLRDNYGVTQIVTDVSSALFQQIENLPLESVVTVTGTVVARSAETVNATLPTGEIELGVEDITVQSLADPLPMPVNQDRKSVV
jgi:aspartyl-tRNA synthetase